MANKSTYTANAQLNAALRNTAFQAPATIYLALFTTNISSPAGTGGTEVSGGGYARQSVASTVFNAAAGGSTSNGSNITFPAATTPGFGTVTGWGLYDASTAGNLLYYGALQGTNDVQTISVSGTPTGGSFTVVFGGVTSPSIPYNATAAQAEELLESMSSIGEGNVSVTGGPLPGTNLTVTFTGSLGSAGQSLMTLGTNSLTGGVSPAPSFTHTTTGSTGSKTVNTGDTFQVASGSFTVSES